MPWAQQTTPSAATQLQQIPTPAKPPARPPELQPSTLEPPPTQTSADSTPVQVQALAFTGNRMFSASELERASGFIPGQRYSLADLRKLAAKITAHYREQGFFLAQTVIPPQDITEGLLQLHVIEGRLGKIHLNNQSEVADRVADAVLRGLGESEAITQTALERRMLLLNDLPGVQAQSTLRPGTSPGSADLQINLVAGPKVSGSWELDNQGNHYTGAFRLGAAVFVNEVAGWGDVASARFLTAGEGLSFARVGYQLPVGQFTVGLGTSSLYYQLGGAFSSLQSKGTAQTSTLFTGYPLVRTRRHNLSAQWAIDFKDFHDRTGAGSPSESSKSSNVHTLGLRGDSQSVHGDQSVRYSATWSRGAITLRDPTTRSNDATTAQSQGDFEKLGYSMSWQWTTAEKKSLYVGLNGQWASKNLDASEKFSLGGSNGVRAYPAGEGSGDEGQLLTLELRAPWTTLSQHLPGSTQAIAFIDTGTVITNKSPWDTGASTKRRSLSGVGAGLNFTNAGKWTASAFCAVKLGDEVATSAPDASWRLWAQVARFF